MSLETADLNNVNMLFDTFGVISYIDSCML